MAWCRLTSSAGLMFLVVGCSSNKELEDILSGRISYPFVETQALGKDPDGESFIIRTRTGGQEYEIELPATDEDFAIEVPFALSPQDQLFQNRGDVDTTTTDRELTKEFPDLTKGNEQQALVGKAFGVLPQDKAYPSYVRGLARTKQYYRERRYEYALVEINDMLRYYPTSPRLHKMKGTVLMRMRNFKLALKSWEFALQLEPNDKPLQKAIASMQARINSMHGESSSVAVPAPAAVPGPAPAAVSAPSAAAPSAVSEGNGAADAAQSAEEILDDDSDLE